jgi:transcriptional regulator with XRE-family HTH domain
MPQPRSGTKLAALLKSAMDKRDFSIREVAALCDMTYEHTRRILKGETWPSPFVLKLLCQHLGVDNEQAELAMMQDKIYRTYGDRVLKLFTKEHEKSIGKIEEIWEKLTPNQQEDAVNLLSGWVRHN